MTPEEREETITLLLLNTNYAESYLRTLSDEQLIRERERYYE